METKTTVSDWSGPRPKYAIAATLVPVELPKEHAHITKARTDMALVTLVVIDNLWVKAELSDEIRDSIMQAMTLAPVAERVWVWVTVKHLVTTYITGIPGEDQ